MDIFSHRVLFPGGGASLADSGYLRTGKILYDLAVKVRYSTSVNPRRSLFPLHDPGEGGGMA